MGKHPLELAAAVGFQDVVVVPMVVEDVGVVRAVERQTAPLGTIGALTHFLGASVLPLPPGLLPPLVAEVPVLLFRCCRLVVGLLLFRPDGAGRRRRRHCRR